MRNAREGPGRPPRAFLACGKGQRWARRRSLRETTFPACATRLASRYKSCVSLYRDEMQAAMERADQLVSENEELEQQAEALSRENDELRARLNVSESPGKPKEERSDAPATSASHARRRNPALVVAAGAAAAGLAVVLALSARHGADPAPRPSDNSQSVGEFDRQGVRRVVDQHRAEVNDVCWGRQAATVASSPTVHAQLVVDAAGRVVRVTAEGTNPSVNACVEQQASSWVFPPAQRAAKFGVTLGPGRTTEKPPSTVP